MKREQKKKPEILKISPKTENLPATLGMLGLVRTELKEEMWSIRADLKADIHGVKKEVHEVKKEVHEVKVEVHALKSEIHDVKSEVQGLKSEIQGLASAVHHLSASVTLFGFKMEEQEARNRAVWEGYASIIQRQDRIDSDHKEMKEIVRSIAKHR